MVKGALMIQTIKVILPGHQTEQRETEIRSREANRGQSAYSTSELKVKSTC